MTSWPVEELDCTPEQLAEGIARHQADNGPLFKALTEAAMEIVRLEGVIEDLKGELATARQDARDWESRYEAVLTPDDRSPY